MKMPARHWGSLILLVAFAFQWFCLDRLKEKAEEIDNVGMEYLHTRMAAEEFFTRFLFTDDDIWLRKAAVEYANAVSLIEIRSQNSRDIALANVKQLQNDAAKVHTLNTYNAFVARLNASENSQHTLYEGAYKRVHSQKRWSWVLFCCASILGMFIAWRADARESGKNAKR